MLLVFFARKGILNLASNLEDSLSNRHRPEPPLQSQESPHGFQARRRPHHQGCHPQR